MATKGIVIAAVFFSLGTISLGSPESAEERLIKWLEELTQDDISEDLVEAIFADELPKLDENNEQEQQEYVEFNYNKLMDKEAQLEKFGGESHDWDQICNLPAEQGLCLAAFRRYYFNPTTCKCQQFIYGGCGGNKNNFETFELCDNYCGRGRGECKPAENQDSDICSQPKYVGNCRANFPRYYFNTETCQCELFRYGGCGANDNNFRTFEECDKACWGSGDCEVINDHEICKLPAKSGNCKADFWPRYYFNTDTCKCEKFFYEGCDGNKNNFPSIEQCEENCGEHRDCLGCADKKPDKEPDETTKKKKKGYSIYRPHFRFGK